MTVRAKFKVASITTHFWSPHAKTVKLQAEYDPTIAEDQRYAQATPSGHIEIQIDNPPAAAYFEMGKAYYLDFTLVDPPVSPMAVAAEAVAAK